MLDENEFKPFTLTDFSVADTSSANTEKSSTTAENSVVSSESTDVEVSGGIEDFKPLTFEEEEVSEEFFSSKSNSSQEEKTDAEKIQLSEEFKNSEFFMENSLLTNAEDFAETIREGAKLHKTQLLKQIEEQANDTDRIHKETVAENQAAEQQRNELLSDTENKIQQIKEKAFKEGFESGHSQGIQKRYDEAEPLAQQANKILEHLDSLRKVVRFQAEGELVTLALKISKNIVAEEIKLNQDVIKNIVKAALHETEVQGKLYLYLNPDDYEFLLNSKTELESYQSEDQNLVIRQNPEMQHGSVHVESDEEIISRSIEEQFKLVEDNLNEQIEIRQAHLNEVDIDSHNFNLTKHDHESNKTKKESPDSQNLKILNESLDQKQSEQGTTLEDFVETEKTDTAFKKEDSVLEDEVLNPLEKSNNLSIENTDNVAYPNETTPPKQNSVSAETTVTEQNNESDVPSDSDGNKEAEEKEETS